MKPEFLLERREIKYIIVGLPMCQSDVLSAPITAARLHPASQVKSSHCQGCGLTQELKQINDTGRIGLVQPGLGGFQDHHPPTQPT